MDLLYPCLVLVSLLLASCCVISHPVQPTTQQDTSVRNLSFGPPQPPTQGVSNKARYFLPYTSDKRNPIYSFGLGKRYFLNDYLVPLYENQALKRSPAGQPRFGFGLGKRSGTATSPDASAELNEYSEYTEPEADNEKRAFEVSDNLDWATDDEDESSDESKYVWNFANNEEKRKISPLRGYYVIYNPNLLSGQPARNLEFKKRAKQHRVSPLGKRLPVYDFGLGKRNSDIMF